MKKTLGLSTAFVSLFFALPAFAQTDPCAQDTFDGIKCAEQLKKEAGSASAARISFVNDDGTRDVISSASDEETQLAAEERAKKIQEAALKKIKEGSQQQFANMDENQDGKISKDEFLNAKIKAFKEAQIKVFDDIDANRDGSISDAEYDQAWEKAFNDMNKTLLDTIKKMKEASQR